jgi:hypothetical protein
MTLDYRKNLGGVDRIIRTAIGLALLIPVFTKTIPGGWAVAAVVLAASQFLEAALAY